MEQIGVAILGIGTIGGEVARRIIASDGPTRPASGVRLQLRSVFDRDQSAADRARLSNVTVTTEGYDVVDDPRVQVVVETLGGEQPAADLMRRALAQGKHVVTANKEAVAKQLPALIAAAEDGQAGFMFEASVGGGIPLVVSLRQIMTNNDVRQIRGILNGTTNFILHKMETEGAEYSDALAEAQELGYAEPDPTADVEGFDAAYKISILASLTSGRHVHPDVVDRTGIVGVSAADMLDAKRRGGTIKLMAETHSSDDELSLKVAPTFLPDTELFARVVRNFNAVEIVGNFVGPVWLHGQGAGPAPTSSAIISDIVEAATIGYAATPKIR